jgi:hypothetical protein
MLNDTQYIDTQRDDSKRYNIQCNGTQNNRNYRTEFGKMALC